MKNYDYERVIQLKHNEIPAKADLDTGEITILKPKRIPNNPDLIPFEPKAIFTREYSKSWNYLYYRLSPLEYRVAHCLAMRAKAFTNSLEPLSEDSTVKEIANAVDISTGKVKDIFEKLLQEGVYGKFQVVEANKKYQKYWILNPYLAFNGKTISKAIVTLFDKTAIAEAFRS